MNIQREPVLMLRRKLNIKFKKIILTGQGTLCGYLTGRQKEQCNERFTDK